MYAVNHWGSHPDAGNDDCWTGTDHETYEGALGAFEKATDSGTAYVELDGPGVYRVRANPVFRPDTGRGEWQREIAMEAGMLHGIDAYNDAMGWS